MTVDQLEMMIQQGVKLTPMFTQYLEIKRAHRDSLLFFRMGDFYELFFEDARLAAGLLNVVLTHRGKLGETPIPMAGVPFHSAASYIDRLTSQGYRVAICEQTEDPRQAKGIVKREVVQVVSPGIPYDIDKKDVREPYYLAAVTFTENLFFLSFVDFTTGDFLGMVAKDAADAYLRLSLYAPKELITFHGQWEEHHPISQLVHQNKIVRSYIAKEWFTPKNVTLYLQRLIPFYQEDKVLQSRAAILAPVGALAYYIFNTQKDSHLIHIHPFRFEQDRDKMHVSLTTLQGLEILPTSAHEYPHTLLGFMDKTLTAMGARELRQLFVTPLKRAKPLLERQQLITFFREQTEALKNARHHLAQMRDLDRVLVKISTQRAHNQDLLNLAGGLQTFFELVDILPTMPTAIFERPELWREQASARQALMQLAQKIHDAVNDEIGASFEKGNAIKWGFHADRDRLYELSHHHNEQLVQLEATYRQQTNISNLKIKYNNITGHFIEISKSHLAKVPESFERRQTLVNAERYTTPELQEFERAIYSAKAELEQIERSIFQELIMEVAQLATPIKSYAKSCALIDLFQSLATVSLQENFTCPLLEEKKQILKVVQGRHPLIQKALRDQFVPHSISLDSNCHFALITGPNMAGKTTVMREMAIIQFLAQIGSFVPAQSAHLGLCDYLFSRLGAWDNILKGQSTFMVEMTQTAEILRHAGPHSFVVIDEVGRGTSTHDGLSIAWALVEHLVHVTKPLTFFSTHYHELVDVVATLPTAANYSMETIVNQGEVQFLYRLIAKGSAQSYGLFVAKLAGLPSSLLQRAEEILTTLEKTPLVSKSNERKRSNTKTEQYDFFRHTPPAPSVLEQELGQIDIMNLTPIKALEKLHQLQQLITYQ